MRRVEAGEVYFFTRVRAASPKLGERLGTLTGPGRSVQQEAVYMKGCRPRRNHLDSPERCDLNQVLSSFATG